MIRYFATSLVGLALSACASIGPRTVAQDRTDYGSSIGISWKEQTLLNIVKLRYADAPVFLEVAQVIAGYQVQSSLGASFTAGNFNAASIGPVTAMGTAAGTATYTDRPTVVYSPLTGVDFLKHLMTPVPPSSVMFVLQAGYAAERVLPIMVDSVNGITNGSNRQNRPPDPRFTRLIELVGGAQLADSIEIRIEKSKEGADNSLVVFPPRKDAAARARRAEITSLLGLNPRLQQLKVYYGAYSGKDDEIDMKTRSMLEIMLEYAATAQVPAADVAQGKASPGSTDVNPQTSMGGPPIRILASTEKPKDPYVAVKYIDRWYWIDNNDIQSKTTFGIVLLMFSIADTGAKAPSPVVTIPASP